MSRELFMKSFLGISIIATSAICQAKCPPGNLARHELLALKENKFELSADKDIQKTAIAIVDCLASKDPVIRDDVAFSALQNWMRTKKLSKATVHSMYELLNQELMDVRMSKSGFAEPFHALALAEVARYDRYDATLDTEERIALVNTAVSYMDRIRDYRGYDETDGYRHGVAHTADLMMQLALNPALEKPQLDQMLVAIANKIKSTEGHAYTYGEPARLMAPVFYIAKRQLHSGPEWKEWFAGIASPKPDGSWNDSMKSRIGWARKHNCEAFLYAMYVNVNESSNEEMHALLMPAIKAAVREMP